ncbi:type II secretion system protein GspM [Vibrio paucivorans]|uniref:Type II secretion system protein M n=1 Tax=Vibrio paucivorans TaxID=2829489 RepID=A0A9X3CB51_9VIBR|nr:type II secretion system protein GspM [Vibrio paucivorans]MCW8332449.1 type II secretion system protein M [Vibrio paucivorans]
MKQAWHQLCEKFAALSEREKWLISLCGLVAVVLGVFTLLLEPAMQSVASQKQQIQAKKLEAQNLQRDILLLTAKLKKDPDQEVNTELKKLLSESQKLSKELSSAVEGLISPTQMSELLENVLAKSDKLHLVSLESLGAESISKNNSTNVGYFVHPVRIELTGRYFDILEYLKALESLPLKYYWRSFQYQVEEYPQARLIMEVYTLGARKEFIGG